jgi:putative nucleotidyltransferase with HDIG domain
MIIAQPLSLEQILTGNIRVPICPSVFLRLMQALYNPDQQNRELVEVLSTDPGLTLQILKCANSALYASTRAIRSIEEAITRLGYAEIWSIATASKGKEMFNPQSQFQQAYFRNQWDHSLKVGIFARTISRRLNPRFADCHFTVGILHDIGKLLLAQACPDYIAQTRLGQVHGEQGVNLERAACGTQHAVIGAELLRHWKIPELIVKPVAQHHDPHTVEDYAKDTYRILALADYMAHSVEASAIEGRRTFRVVLPQTLAERTGLKIEDFTSISSETLRQIAVLRSL